MKRSAKAAGSGNELERWLVVVVFSVAMAWLEAAVVFYLRTLVGRLQPYQARPLPVADDIGAAELVRELATLVMLLGVGWLAGRTWRSRLGYAMLAFGIWDIFYYGFLKVLTGWPQSFLDWDILFLIPLPWWGPVVAPMVIAGLMIAYGTLVSQWDSPVQPVWPGWRTSLLGWAGVFLALYVFMADALGSVAGGLEALRDLLPTSFHWYPFGFAVALMAAPVLDLCRQIGWPSSGGNGATP